MPNGTVKWFNPNKGFGFIEPEGGSQDVFVHISAVEAAGMNTLNDGAKVSFELETGKNSVKPWIIPSIKASKKDIYSLSSVFSLLKIFLIEI